MPNDRHESVSVLTPNTSKHKPSRSFSAPPTRQSLIEGSDTESKFPRIEDCEHFHYDSVDYGKIKVALIEDSADGLNINGSLNFEDCKPVFGVRITCQGNSCVVRRSLSHFQTLDKWLHECVYDRTFSQLQSIVESELISKKIRNIQNRLRIYLNQFSSLTGGDDVISSRIACAPVLHWLEIDNHGRNLAPHALGDVADINIPAVAAARVVKRYQAQEDDDLSLEVGDMVSIIEMGATGWWRGKQGLKVGSFPSQCVRRINSATDVIATHDRAFSPPLHATPNKPIARKHGTFMEFLRSFLDTRPSKAQLKRKGILRERIFGCDLGEYLHRSEDDIPAVVKDCTKFVESHGIVDGIYRISGVASHIRFLRYEFDSDRRPDLEQDIAGLPNNAHIPGMSKNGNLICDPHSVAGLCKLYFRELPNPLLTYQLYDRFASAVTDYVAEERLLKVHDVIQQLPPPHYRTLKHLITHLQFMAQQDGMTSMHCRNLAIVWAPNLLRSRDLEAGLAAFTEARVQSVVTEFLIVNGDILFSDQLQTKQYDAEHKPPRPRSLMILPPPKLISLEEAQARSKGGMVAPVSSEISDPSAPRMRNHDGKSASYERRKRGHKRGAGVSTLPHHYPSRVKKQGGAQQCTNSTGSVEELRSGETSPKHPGWKTKLGSLLKKGTSVQREASLRRCQSDDSLASHGSQQTGSKAKRPLDFSQTSLSHAVSLEGHGSLDRQFPEPQTSPVVLRHTVLDGDKENKSRRRHSRPTGGIYSDKMNAHKSTGGHSFQPTFLPLKNKPNETNSDGIRSCSPFSGLASDFSNVMGETGLDFDPLNYRSTLNLRTLTPDQEREGIISDDNAMVTVKRVASVQSLHGETVFAAISTAKTSPSQNQNNNRSSHVTASNQFEDWTSESIDFESSGSKSERLFKKPSTFARDQLLKRRSLKENARRQKKTDAPKNWNSGKNIDALTADDCVGVSESTSKPTKLTAAELLGVSPRKLSPDRGKDFKSIKMNTNDSTDGEKVDKNVSGNNGGVGSGDSDSQLDLNENFKFMDLKEEKSPTLNKETFLDFTTSNKRYSVQCYSIPEEKGLQKKSHYGSFIALVGLKSDESENFKTRDSSHRKVTKTYSEHFTSSSRMHDSKQPIYPANQWRQPNVNKTYNHPTHNNDNQRYENHPNYSYDNRPQNYVSDRSRQDSHSMKIIGYERDNTYSGNPCTVYTPKLDTFNPEGRQRQDYDLTPPKPDFMTSFDSSPTYESHNKPYHNRSHSVDSYPSEHGTVLPQRHRSVTAQHRNGTTYHPSPAPRKHGRSLSTGDDSEPPPEFGRPIPLPRRMSRSSPHGGNYPPPVCTNHEWRNQRRFPGNPPPLQPHQNYPPTSAYPPDNHPAPSYDSASTSYSNRTYELVEVAQKHAHKTPPYHEQNSFPPRRKLFRQNELERRVIDRDFGDDNSYPPRGYYDDVTPPGDVTLPARDFYDSPHRSRGSTRRVTSNYPPRDVTQHNYDVTPRRQQQRASYAEGMQFSHQQRQLNPSYSPAGIPPSYYQRETYHVTPGQDFSANQGAPRSSLSWV